MNRGRLLVAQGADDEAVSAANAAPTIITGYFPQQERERVWRRFTDAMYERIP